MGIQVSCEDLFSGHRWKVCHAYATFVTQRTETGGRVSVRLIIPRSRAEIRLILESWFVNRKATFHSDVCRSNRPTRSDVPWQVMLEPIVPQTQTEQLEYSLAAERRRVRMVHDDIIKALLTHGCFQQGGCDWWNHWNKKKTKNKWVTIKTYMWQETGWNWAMQWQQRGPRWKVLSWFYHHILTIRLLSIYYKNTVGKFWTCSEFIYLELSVICHYNTDYTWGLYYSITFLKIQNR